MTEIFRFHSNLIAKSYLTKSARTMWTLQICSQYSQLELICCLFLDFACARFVGRVLLELEKIRRHDVGDFVGYAHKNNGQQDKQNDVYG